MHYYDHERDYKSYPDYTYSYTQSPFEYIPDELTYRNSRITSHERRHRRRPSNYSHNSNVNRGFDQVSEIDTEKILDIQNSLLSPIRNRHEFHSQVTERSDELISSIRKYSKSLAGTPTNSRIPINSTNREEFTTFGNRVGRSQSTSQSKHRRFNSTSNSFRYYNDNSTSEKHSQTLS